MANTSFTKTDLLDLGNEITSLVNISIETRSKLRRNDLITKQENDDISGLETELLNYANAMTNLAIKQVITDLDNAKEILGRTTKQLNDVITRLNKFNDFLKMFTNLIGVFSTISKAVAGGPVVLISSLVGELEKFTNSTTSTTTDVASRSVSFTSQNADLQADNISLGTTDLFDLVKGIVNVVKTNTERRMDLRSRSVITKEQNELLFLSEIRLLNLANYAANSEIQQVKTDVNDVAKVLIKATETLKDTINSLNDVNKFIKTLSTLIHIFSRISQAIAGDSVAIINSLVEELVKLTNSTTGTTSDVAYRTASFSSENEMNSEADSASETMGNINEI